MYRRVLLSAVTSVALVSSAFAADIYMPSAPYAAVALPPSSAGFYLGVNGGYGGENGLPFTNSVYNITNVPPTNYSTLIGASTIAGGFGGGQLGYNFQFGSFVAGFETDIQGSNIMGSGSQTAINPMGTSTVACGAPGTGIYNGVCTAKNGLDVDWFGTVRGRLGYAWGGTLLYVTGGFAYGGVKLSDSWANNVNENPSLPNGPGTYAGRASSNLTQTGWAAGAGIETKLAPNWSLKGEYQFVDLGTVSAGPEPLIAPNGISTCATGNGPCYTARSDSRVEFNTVRVGINYYFNAPPPPLPIK